MPDYEQDIIRTVRIQTQVDTETIQKSSTTLDNFYKKYQNKSMRIDTQDFSRAVDAVRTLRKELDTTQKNSPKMTDTIKYMSEELERAGQQFGEVIVQFTNGDIAKGLNEAVNKISQGLQIKSVDLGDFLSSVQRSAKNAVDALKEIGAVNTNPSGKNYFTMGSVNISQLEDALDLMQNLKEAQQELDTFYEKNLGRDELYSNTTTDALESHIRSFKSELEIIKQLSLTDDDFRKRRELMSELGSNAVNTYGKSDFNRIKDAVKEDEAYYDYYVSNLRKHISETEALMQKLKGNSNLFTNTEMTQHSEQLSYTLEVVKQQVQELQQFGPKVADPQIGGDFSELTKVLNEIKTSLQVISDVFKNESTAMNAMVEGEVSSFKSWSEAIVAVYDNLSRLGELVNTISQKDFNVTNITNPTPTSTSTSKRQGVKQLKAEVEAEMQHVKTLYAEIDKLLMQLQQGRMNNEFRLLAGTLNELDATTYEDFEKTMLGQMADAKTKVKIENLLVVLDGYIDKLTVINKLREQYGLGEWQDPFAKPSQPTVQPTAQSKPQVTETPIVAQPQNTIATTNTEAQQMWQLKAAIDEVSNAIGRKNAGFVKEKEIVDSSVKAEEAKLRELVGVITNEIGNALDGIKEKFTQSFVTPEINKVGLQESLNGIYNEFAKLQKNIEDLKINVGVGTIVEATTPSVVDSASKAEEAVGDEAQSAKGVDESFTDATNAKKEFTEANKQVAKSAEETTKAVEKEAEAAKQAKETMVVDASDATQPTTWDRIAQIQADYDSDPLALTRSRTEDVGDKSVRSVVEFWKPVRDEDGQLTGELELNTVKIANDFKKRADAIADENKKIKGAQADLHEFLTQFDNKTMGEGKKLNGYQDLVKLASKPDFNLDDIDKADQMMKNLNAEYNKVVQSIRKGSSSMNPFVNAINGMGKMEDVLRGIYLQFQTLKDQPEWLKNQIIDLYKQFDNVSAESDIYKFAEGFGNLRVSINSVTESIRQQRIEQKLATADFNALVKATKGRDTNIEKAAKEEDGSVWKQYYLDRAAEQQKIIDAIRIGLVLTEDQETQLNAMSEKHALILRDINLENNKIEEQKQKYEEIMRLLEQNHADQIGLDSGSLKVVDKEAYQQRLNAERAQIDALIKGANLDPQQTKSVQDFVKLIADLKVESSNIDLMSKKWAEQNILTDEAKTKIEALRQSLLKVTSGSELGSWKKEWKEFTNEMSIANIEAKEDKKIGKLFEDDRVAEVEKYIDLLKLQQDYEKKAAKEDNGSKMQSFYNEQIAKVKEKIKTINIDDIANQEEKNRLLELEEAHQRAIAEIEAKKNANAKSVMPFDSEDGKIQQKYEAGYLRNGLYNDWQKELAEYRNYMTGVTEADEATIQNKKRSLMQLYDSLTKMSNASKSFFASGGEMLPTWFTPEQMQDTKKSLMELYNTIVTERFEGMKTSVTGVSEKLGKLNFVVDDGNGSLTQYTIALDRASGATKLLDNSTKPALTTLQRFGQHLKKDFTGILHSIIGGSGVHAFVRYIREGVQAVRELDLALTELKKVTDATEETYDRFLGTAAETSSRIGRTITDMTSATAEFAKLGYDIDLASQMAESALVYANVGDNVDVETGSQSIISTMKAFGVETNNTMSIVDKFNEIGNNFAITTKGIGDALQVSASAMAAAGNTLDETIALTTAANTIVQNPNTVGTALKTLSLRIRGVKTE